ncbi:replication-relaxation family protein [Streptomyces sp. NBC_00144]|uniref:replication-relaxation family protein n=1 Tax=Streptomyces sp. NBC_00144 TaxID=2975665 RepID=UPI00324AC172
MPRLNSAGRGLSRLSQEALPVLYRHRLLTAHQMQRLLRPKLTSTRYLRDQLHQLHNLGLADATVRHHNRAGEHLWYITNLGCEVVESGGETTPRAYRMSEQAAASQLQEHTIAVNETGLAFVEHARRLGDECGPLDWDPELSHRVRDGDSRLGDEAFLIPDAVLSYVRTQGDERALLTFFCEIDRSTMTIARLAGKLHAYARYATYVPSPQAPGRRRPARPAAFGREAWRERYPAFPRILLVLTGAPLHVLSKRAADLRALATADPRLARAADQLRAGVTTLELLQVHGPFAPIITPVLGDPAPTDVLLAAAHVSALPALALT